MAGSLTMAQPLVRETIIYWCRSHDSLDLKAILGRWISTTISNMDLKALKRWQQSVLHWILVMQRICVPAAESPESSSQRISADPETQLLQVWRSTEGARPYFSSLALDILTPSPVTQDRFTAKQQTGRSKMLKGSIRCNDTKAVCKSLWPSWQ